MAGFLVGRHHDEVCRLASSALSGGVLLDAMGPDGPAYQAALATLVLCGAFDEAEAVIDDGLTEARRIGSPMAIATMQYRRSVLRFQRGDLAGAVADARTVLAGAPPGWRMYRPVVRAVLAQALLEKGDIAGARNALAAGSRQAGAGTGMQAWRRQARGSLRLARGDAEKAKADFLAAGALFTGRLHLQNPSGAPWRSLAAQAYQQLGDRQHALPLADEEVKLARAFGAGEPLGTALRVAGGVRGDRHGLPLLEEAATVLEGSAAVLERAKAELELGAALRRTGRERHAVAHLHTAVELSLQCDAPIVAGRASEELHRAGGRAGPSPARGGGANVLTASEQRVVELAKEGYTNKEIAGRLYVSVKAVEYHLSNAYPKLGISSRRQLGAALAERLGAN